ncbi:MAG TPA: hypothetical protein VM370_05800 [Candidatus Thermoplasmatota archaeon]|nr:hypothetical protein [Candidatus Thermoplasmatota archaeon]
MDWSAARLYMLGFTVALLGVSAVVTACYVKLGTDGPGIPDLPPSSTPPQASAPASEPGDDRDEGPLSEVGVDGPLPLPTPPPVKRPTVPTLPSPKPPVIPGGAPRAGGMGAGGDAHDEHAGEDGDADADEGNDADEVGDEDAGEDEEEDEGDDDASPLPTDGLPDAPVDEPALPVDAPESPVDEPASPVDAPESPVDEPALPVDAPESPVEEPTLPAQEPPVGIEAPEPGVEAPIGSDGVSTPSAPTPEALAAPADAPLTFDPAIGEPVALDVPVATLPQPDAGALPAAPVSAPAPSLPWL